MAKGINEPNNREDSSSSFNENQNLEIHRENYRISFDAMRAYHVSEIEHKRDMIAILNGIMAIIVTVYGGIFYVVIQDKLLTIKFVLLFSLPILMIVINVLIALLLKSSIRKLEGDNNRFERFRNECIIERNYLGLSKYYEKVGNENLYWNITLPNDLGSKSETTTSDHIRLTENQTRNHANHNSQTLREGSGFIKTAGIIQTYSRLLNMIQLIIGATAWMVLFFTRGN